MLASQAGFVMRSDVTSQHQIFETAAEQVSARASSMQIARPTRGIRAKRKPMVEIIRINSLIYKD
ncbi:hypothetical protein CXK91_13490 [Stutzerimonas stutzeri]|uniref:Uncharacterized protein n=1 Tax=Stutzerimonas stutzeri TaxID=316 RepID=A0A2S4ALG3_STUST|nr:hypothetical protein CXK91_13490 [Stutzerimonas stutzeri]